MFQVPIYPIAELASLERQRDARRDPYLEPCRLLASGSQQDHAWRKSFDKHAMT